MRWNTWCIVRDRLPQYKHGAHRLEGARRFVFELGEALVKWGLEQASSDQDGKFLLPKRAGRPASYATTECEAASHDYVKFGRQSPSGCAGRCMMVQQAPRSPTRPRGRGSRGALDASTVRVVRPSYGCAACGCYICKDCWPLWDHDRCSLQPTPPAGSAATWGEYALKYRSRGEPME